MDNSLNINTEELEEFKTQVKHWLSIDQQIIDLETKIKDLKN